MEIKYVDFDQVAHINLEITNGTEVLVPPIHDRGPNYPKIVLGKSTYKDIFSIKEPIKLIVHDGTNIGATSVGVEFYFGGFGGYSNFTFGSQGLVLGNQLKDNWRVLDKYKPNYVCIH